MIGKVIQKGGVSRMPEERASEQTSVLMEESRVFNPPKDLSRIPMSCST
jgi:hypothetical protein